MRVHRKLIGSGVVQNTVVDSVFTSVQLVTLSNHLPPSSSYLIEEDSLNYLIEEDSLNRLIEQPYPTDVPVIPEPPAEPLSINLYKGHGVLDLYSGLESTVIVENGLVRVWHTAEDYTNSIYAPGGASYGTVVYPFTNVRIVYKDISVLEFENCIENELTLNWQNIGTCVPYVSRSCVYKDGNGTYHLLGINVQNNYNAYAMEYWTSPSGNPDSWTQISANIGVFGYPYHMGNCSFFLNNGTWNVWIEYANPSTWKGSYWEGSSLTSLSRIDSDASPAVVPTNMGTSIGDVQHITYGNKWIYFGHDSNNLSSVTPTDITFYTSDNKGSGWTRKLWVLQLTSIGFFNGDQLKPFNDDSQIADPYMFEINGRTYMMYETIWKELYDIPSLSLAWWNGTKETLINQLLTQ